MEVSGLLPTSASCKKTNCSLSLLCNSIQQRKIFGLFPLYIESWTLNFETWSEWILSWLIIFSCLSLFHPQLSFLVDPVLCGCSTATYAYLDTGVIVLWMGLVLFLWTNHLMNEGAHHWASSLDFLVGQRKRGNRRELLPLGTRSVERSDVAVRVS